MFALERQKKILEILDAEGSVQVSKLSLVLDVTEETVRRDLEKLEKQVLREEKTAEIRKEKTMKKYISIRFGSKWRKITIISRI